MTLIELIVLMTPAYAANMAPPFVRFWRGWNPPIHERALGSHKTVVGFALGVVVGVLTAWALAHAAIAGTERFTGAWWIWGLTQGVGAMAGDAAKSFVKRRIGVPPGASWMPADQLDFVAGALLLGAPWLALGWRELLVIAVVTFAGDLVVNRISYALGIRATKL